MASQYCVILLSNKIVKLITMKKLRIATRKSPLALWQANYVGDQIKKHWPALQIELVPMLTSGDKFLKDKLLLIGNKGLFVKELEEALLSGRADIAVHSMKDVPALLPKGLELATICKRHSPLDALISRESKHLHELSPASVVGTISLRRQAQILAQRPDLHIKALRGNINTRLDKLRAGEYDAIVLAVAGLERMALEEQITEILPEETMLPACGQGALGIECREQKDNLKEILAPLHDPLSALCVFSERQVNAALGGNCHIPLAVFCKPLANKQLLLQAKIFTSDGKTIISDSQYGNQEEASHLAHSCVQALVAKGAHQLLSIPYE